MFSCIEIAAAQVAARQRVFHLRLSYMDSQVSTLWRTVIIMAIIIILVHFQYVNIFDRTVATKYVVIGVSVGLSVFTVV